MRNSKQITHWGDPLDIIESGYGKITYQVWCQKERDRINEGGDTVKIITRKDGFIALTK